MIADPVENIVDCVFAEEAIGTLNLRSEADCGAGSARCYEVSPAEMPEPFQSLLFHTGQMSEALEKFYGAPLELHVMGVRADWANDDYGRKVFLTLEAKDAIVGYGRIHVRLQHLPDEAVKRIRQAVHPIGRILSRHKIDRRV